MSNHDELVLALIVTGPLLLLLIALIYQGVQDYRGRQTFMDRFAGKISDPRWRQP